MSSSRRKISNTYCAISTCKKRKTGDLSFHLFPKRMEIKRQWMEKCKIDHVTKYTTICANHFVDYDFFGKDRKRRQLKKIAIPSRNLPSNKSTNKSCKMVQSKVKHHKKQDADNEQPHYEIINVTTLDIKKEEPDFDTNVPIVTETVTQSNLSPSIETLDTQKERYTSLLDRISNSNISAYVPQVKQEVTSESYPELNLECQIIERERNLALTELKTVCAPHKDIIIKNGSVACRHYMTGSKITLGDIVTLENEVRAFTGASATCLKNLVDVISNLGFVSKVYVPPVRDRILLCLCKLRLNLSFSCLKVLFNMSASLCNSMFQEMVHLLSGILHRAVYWQDRSDTLRTLPKCFSDFSRTRVVLDKIEIKGCNVNQSLKFIIGLSPGGFIVYKSSVQVLKISDGDIFADSKLIDKMIPGEDVIMAGENVAIEHECSQVGIELIKARESGGIIFKNKIGKARYFVDKTIYNIKDFLSIEKASWETIDFLNDIITIILGIINLSRNKNSEENNQL